MSVQHVPDEYRDYIMSRISPSVSFFTEKNLSPLFTPSHEFLYGLYLASNVNESLPSVNYRTESDLDKLYEDGTIDADTPLTGGKPGIPRTYGRIRLSMILGDNIDNILGKDVPIDAKNIILIMSKVNLHEDRLERLKRLQDLSVEQMRLIGITALNMKDLYVSLKPEFRDNINKVIDDDSLSQPQKLIKVNEIYSKYIKDEFEHSVNKKVMDMAKYSDRVKVDQLVNITMPNMIISGDGNIKVSESSLFQGMTPDDYAAHSVSNRHVLQIKSNVVPSSGYMTRQLAYITQMFRFKDADQPSKDYIEIERSKMVGRVTIDGKYIGSSYEKDNTKDKFPSCIFNTEPVIYHNQIRTPNHKEGVVNGMEQYDGDNIGLSFGTSITESITQGGLALKHGGALRMVVDDYKLIAKSKGKVTEVNEHTIKLSDGSVYPITSHFAVINQTYNPGDTIGYVNVVMTPAYKADSMVMLLDAFSRGSNRMERNYLHKGLSIAPKSGKINYKYSDKIEVFIDSEWITNIPYDNYTLLYHPDGDHVNIGDRISTDVLDMTTLNLSLAERYYAFRNEFNRIFQSKMTEELIEFLFRCLFDMEGNGYLGIRGSINKKIPLMSQISFGYASNHLRKVDDTELELQGTDAYDLFTNLILGISNNQV